MSLNIYIQPINLFGQLEYYYKRILHHEKDSIYKYFIFIR